MPHFELLQTDITTLDVDAVVNAANSSLMGGGGVDGAIHRAGGKAILKECKEIRAQQGECPPGEAVITTAGEMPAQKVIHTVGPRYKNGNFGEAETLKSCYVNSLKLAEKNQLKSVAFPNISTGIYGFPKKEAARIAIEAVRNYPGFKNLEKVIFVCFDKENYDIYRGLMSD